MNKNEPSHKNGSGGWRSYENGLTIGTRGSEGGEIIRDEEHADGARISLERNTLYNVPFAITCGIYGWMVHTRFFADEPGAFAAYEQMKTAITAILELIVHESAVDTVSEAVEQFVENYP